MLAQLWSDTVGCLAYDHAPVFTSLVLLEGYQPCAAS